MFAVRTFRAAVAGSFFTRISIGGIPFLFTLLYQVGLGYSAIQSGLLMMPQAFAAMLRAAGFARVTHKTMSGGIVALHSGWRL